ncbi:GNAT family N-acetyltransferase [Clostridium sp. YIM B02551]|uniref:GNAT family N-acetyltransferase n=1 Tax=Clostridium sp. YIM B02551 TaxID=2910679 RepID=UPI001EEA6E2E|nr:GNAT family N-acetyltransferase [Clostridium sp. YIM B02551]
MNIEKVKQENMEEVIKLSIEVFKKEQHIPEELIPISEEFEPIWWCGKLNGEIVAVVASWKKEGEWHWGRYAVDKKLRGKGLGKKIALFSLNEVFNLGAEEIYIEARDITLKMLEKLGCEVIGNAEDFYGDRVTPIVLKKNKFIHR